MTDNNSLFAIFPEKKFKAWMGQDYLFQCSYSNTLIS